jgi:hypothetical protein
VSLGRPAVRITVDGQALTAPEAALVDLRVELAVGARHDAASVSLAPDTPLADVDPRASFELALGYGDDVADVLTGTVAAADRRPDRVVLHALSSTAALTRTWVGRSYLSQTVDGIVRDLASAAGVDTGEVLAPLQLAAFHVDERRAAWTHVRVLAALAACELSSTSGGALNFRTPKSSPLADHEPRAGAELVSWDLGRREDGPASPTVVATGAASEQGPAKWHLLLKEPDGGAPDGVVLAPSAVRDREVASSLESGLKDAAARRARSGRLVLVGDASIRAGDLVAPRDVPGRDDVLRAVAVTHTIGAGGFRTDVRVEAAA